MFSFRADERAEKTLDLIQGPATMSLSIASIKVGENPKLIHNARHALAESLAAFITKEQS